MTFQRRYMPIRTVSLSAVIAVAACSSPSEDEASPNSDVVQSSVPLSAFVQGQALDDDFLETHQERFVDPRAFPGDSVDEQARASALAAEEISRLSLGLPHVFPQFIEAPASPTCGGCVLPNECIQGFCAPPCAGGEFPCQGGTIPMTTPDGCFCVPSPAPPDGGAGGAGGGGGGDAGTGGSPPPGTCVWTSVGPTNIHGRITGIAIDPNDSQRIYATGVGGIWRSKDGGRRWQRVSDSLPAGITSAVAVNPGNSTEVLVGLGEPNYLFGSGSGLRRSLSSGDPNSWTDVSPVGLKTAVVHKIIYSPTAPNDVYLASTVGVFVGKHMGAGGKTVTFTRVANFDASASDIAVDFSATPVVVYAGVQSGSATFAAGIWRFDGTKWTLRSQGIDTTKSRRIALGLAPSAPQTLYARVENNGNGRLLGIFKTVDAGANWAADSVAGTTALDDGIFSQPGVVCTPGGMDACAGYSWWGNVLAVDPTNPEIVFSGGVGLYRRTSTGWGNVSTGPDMAFPLGLHGDQHAIVFDNADPKIVFVGNDGGIYQSTTMSAATWHWQSKAHGMVLTEFYRVTSQQAAATTVAGGSQDNGTEITFGNRTWFNPGGCDGNDVAIDATNSSTLYANCNGGLFEFANPVPYTPGGQSQVPLALPAGVTLKSPLHADPSKAGIALSAGDVAAPMPDGGAGDGGMPAPKPGDVVVKTTDGTNWTASLSTAKGTAVTAIGISTTNDPTSNKKIYYAGVAGMTTTVDTSTDEGANWITNNPALPGRINEIAVDPTNARRAFAALANGGAGSIFMTSDSGKTWSPLPSTGATAFPAAPANGVVVDPFNTNVVYASTTIGVFKGVVSASPPSSSWVPFDEGLPTGIDVQSISIEPTNGILSIGTMGYGAYHRDIKPGDACPGTFLVVRDNVFDRGVTPSPNAVPDPEHPTADPARPKFFKPDDSPGGSLYWWMSTDIRIDVPSQDKPANTVTAADNFEFESCPVEITSCTPGTLIDRSPIRGQAAKAYVQVSNRGISSASNVRVITLFTDASTHVPDLPADFWTTTLPSGGNSCGALNTTGGWSLVGCQVIPVVNPLLPEVAGFDFAVPASAAEHSCMLTIIDSADDPIAASTRGKFSIADLVPNDRHISQRNLHVIDAPPAPGGGGATGGGSPAPYAGITSVEVPNRGAQTGVDIIVSRSQMGTAGRLQVALQPGRASQATGLPPKCGVATTPTGGSVISLDLPKGISDEDFAVAAGGTLWLLDGARVQEASGSGALVANAGTAQTVIGTAASSGSVTSVAAIELDPQSRVNGDVTSGSTVSKRSGAVVSGQIHQKVSLTPVTRISVVGPQAPTNPTTLVIPPHQPTTLKPGTFGAVVLVDGSEVMLHGGVYVFDTLDIDPRAKVTVDTTAAPLQIYIFSRWSAGVPFLDLAGHVAEATVVYLGISNLILHAPFSGTVLAPKASLQLGTVKGDRFEGKFYGKLLFVGPGGLVVHRATGSLATIGACAPLSASERSTAVTLGLDPNQLFGIAGQETTLHLPIPAGQTWRLGLRFEAASASLGLAQRFSVVAKEGGKVVGGNTFVLRH